MQSLLRAGGIFAVGVLLAGCAPRPAGRAGTAMTRRPKGVPRPGTAWFTTVPAARVPARMELPALTTLSMVTGNTGWGASQSQVFWTDTGWRSWTAVTPSRLPSGSTLVLDAVDATTAWVGVAADTANTPAPLYLTVDHGKTWRRMAVPGSIDGLAWPHFFSAKVGYVAVGMVGTMGSETMVIQATGDGGEHWHTLRSSISPAMVTAGHLPPPAAHHIPFFGDKSGMVWATPSDGWISGGYVGPVSGGGMLYRTTDKGATWLPVALPGRGANAPQWVLPPVFSSAAYGVVPVKIGPGLYVIDQTHDGGAAWTEGAALSWEMAGGSLWAFSGVSDGLAVSKILNGENTGVATSALYRTTDGGRSWTKVLTNLPLDAVTAITLVGGALAYASCSPGHGGVLWESGNGGSSWTPISAASSGQLP